MFAPIALFVYNRVDTLKITVDSLLENEESCNSELFVFSDGGRDEKSWKQVKNVRSYLETVRGFKKIHIVERPVNYYLERNVIEGIGEVFEKFDRIIVLEDDVLLSKYFLKYMNDAFDRYANEKKVMHVAGFTNLYVPEKGDTYFSPHMTGSGAWGTWKDRWEDAFRYFETKSDALDGLTEADLSRIEYNGNCKCLQSLDRSPIPWDICWTIGIYRKRGLCLHPTRTLVRNIGLSAGTHFDFKNSRIWGRYDFDRPPYESEVCLGNVEVEADGEIEAAYANALKDHGFRYNLLGRIVRFFYLKIK